MFEFDILKNINTVYTDYDSIIENFRYNLHLLKVKEMPYRFYKYIVFKSKISNFNKLIKEELNDHLEEDDEKYPLFDESNTTEEYYNKCLNQVLYFLIQETKITDIVLYNNDYYVDNKNDLVIYKTTFKIYDFLKDISNLGDFCDSFNVDNVLVYTDKEDETKLVIIPRKVKQIITL